MAIQAQMYPENLGLPLGGSQDWLMMDNSNNIINNNNNNNNNLLFNGCGFNELSFNLQQKQQQQQQQQFQYQQQQQFLLQQFQNMQRNQNQNQNQSVSSDNGFVFLPSSKRAKTNNNNNTAPCTSTITTSSDSMAVNFSQSLLASQLEKQRHEIDRYISLQNERLKLALQEQRKQQLATLMKKLEAKAMMLLKQKDEEISKATKRTMELEDFVRNMEVENQAWQRVAAENEAMVVSLNNALEQLKEQQAVCCLTNSNGVDDAESCCDDNDYPFSKNNNKNEEEEIGTGENREMNNNNNNNKMMMVCKVCNSRESCVLMLPCRHLCSCKECDAFLDACPVCKSVKKASIQALLS